MPVLRQSLDHIGDELVEVRLWELDRFGRAEMNGRCLISIRIVSPN
jgi:hypothetical protein